MSLKVTVTLKDLDLEDMIWTINPMHSDHSEKELPKSSWLQRRLSHDPNV